MKHQFADHIFKNIWVNPGQVSDPPKIISYLKAHKFMIGGIDITKKSERVREEELRQGNMGLENTYKFFKSTLGKDLHEIKEELDESFFEKGPKVRNVRPAATFPVNALKQLIQ
jgi:hypothetical protein